VPAGDEQRQYRELRLGRRGFVRGVQPGGVDVPLEVVHADERFPGSHRQALGRVQPDHQRAGQTGSARGGDGVHVADGHVRFGERLLDDRHDGQHVLARGHLREDAAVARVHVHLRGDGGGDERASVFEHGCGGLIAGGFDGEDAGGGKNRNGRHRKVERKQ
jgi:hypothetical protein